MTATPDPGLVAVAADLRVVMSRLGRRTRAAGGCLTPSQLSALTTLDECGELRLNELAAREGVAAPTMSRAVDELERRELVQRRSDPSDARAAFIGLTARGRETVGQAADERTTLLAAHLGKLDHDHIAAIRAALPALRSLIETFGTATAS